jgi:hypothetical protein
MSDKTLTVTPPTSLAVNVKPPKVFSVNMFDVNVVAVSVQAPKLLKTVVTAPKNVTIKVSKVGVQGFEGPIGQTVALLSSSNW